MLLTSLCTGLLTIWTQFMQMTKYQQTNTNTLIFELHGLQCHAMTLQICSNKHVEIRVHLIWMLSTALTSHVNSCHGWGVKNFSIVCISYDWKTILLSILENKLLEVRCYVISSCDLIIARPVSLTLLLDYIFLHKKLSNSLSRLCLLNENSRLQ